MRHALSLAVAVLALMAFCFAALYAEDASAARYWGKKVTARTTVYSYPMRVADYIQSSHYQGRCGAGAARCRYNGRPFITSCRLNGWCRFLYGYYQEWRPTWSFPPWRLFVCHVNGWAKPGRGVALTYRSCGRI